MNSFNLGTPSPSPPSSLPHNHTSPLYSNYGGGNNGHDSGLEGSGDSCDFGDDLNSSASMSMMADYLNQHPGLIYTYDVRFKTCTEQYLFHEKLAVGEMVTVQCERGYNIGFVDGEALPDPENPPQKRILAKLLDEDNTIKDMLKFKIIAEKNALAQCRVHCKGHRLGSFADSIAAEFQFDRKKLTVYLKKYEDVSVCRLVRKLYDTYKMRIKVLEVDNPETMKDLTKKYLDLSKLNIALSDAFNYDPATSVLYSKNQAKPTNKSEKQTPSYSKSHLGKSQHLIPSLVQYGPQAEKRHNQPTFHQQNFFPTTITTSNTNPGQPQRSDRLTNNNNNNRDYHHHQHQQLHQHHQQQQYGRVYEQQPLSPLPHHHSVTLVHNFPTTGPACNNSSSIHPSLSQPHSSWSSTNVNQRGNWYRMDQPQAQLQFEKPAIHTNYLEPFGHERSFDDAFYRHHSSNPPLPPPPIFGEYEDYSRPSMDFHGSRRDSEASTSSLYDLEVLSAALSSASMDKRPSNSSISTSSPSPTSSLIESTHQTQLPASSYHFPETSF